MYRTILQVKKRICHALGLRFKNINFAKTLVRDVSGFVHLFYILSKNKIFCIFGRHILAFWPIISHFSLIYRTFYVKNRFLSKSRISAQFRIGPRMLWPNMGPLVKSMEK